ncbi:MAG: DoxX family protein [Patescibacteria group bacterium]
MKTLRILLFIIFFVEGVTKLIGLQFQTDFFTAWGYPLWFMYVVGVLELAGALGLLMSKYRLCATIGLLGIMVGAFYTHISRNDPPQMMGLAILASTLLSLHLFFLIKKNKEISI